MGLWAWKHMCDELPSCHSDIHFIHILNSRPIKAFQPIQIYLSTPLKKTFGDTHFNWEYSFNIKWHLLEADKSS